MSKCEITPSLRGYVYETGYRVAEKKGFVIFWISVGNSYFKPENIERIINFVSDNFSKVRVLVPIEPAEHTYAAMGYEEKRARKKARLNSNRIKNHVNRVIEKIKEKHPDTDIKITKWDEEILTNEKYQGTLDEILNLYEKSRKFRKDARETTKSVLKGKLKDNVNMEKAIDRGVKYLLEELAFVMASPLIYHVKDIAYIYHKKWEIYANLVNGVYDFRKKGNLGFILIK